MVKICLKRTGKTKHPLYRVIVLDKQKDTLGTYLENLGWYNPHTKEAQLNGEAIKSWIAKGAQPSATVHNLLVTQKIIDATKKRVSKMSKRHKERLDAKKPTGKTAEQPTTTEQPAA
jgi:small subunit ribosomal protein S16